MSSNKTVPTGFSVQEFLDNIDDDQRRQDSIMVCEMMKNATGMEPQMWGPSIVGFDTYHYKYESGREGDFLIVGFSPRKTALSIYMTAGFESHDDLMKKLGKYKTGKSCLYIKKLSDIDKSVLQELIEKSVKHMREKYH